MKLPEERDIMSLIRLELSKRGVTTFRANAGRAWTSNDIVKLQNGDILLRQPRPFNALQSGFADLFGITPKQITQEDVGKTVAVFTALECKAPGKKPTEKQQHFLDFVEEQGGIAGVARSVADALEIIGE